MLQQVQAKKEKEKGKETENESDKEKLRLKKEFINTTPVGEKKGTNCIVSNNS